MWLRLAVVDRATVQALATLPLTTEFPQLRLYCVPGGGAAEAVDLLPPDVRAVVSAVPEAEQLADVHGVLALDLSVVASLLPQVGVDAMVRLAHLAPIYRTWMTTRFLPFMAGVGSASPVGLYPASTQRRALSLAITGSCEADFIARSVDAVAQQLQTVVTTVFRLQNHPVPSPAAPGVQVHLVIPPFRYMHPKTLDDFVLRQDREQLLEEVLEHAAAYLAAALQSQPAELHLVAGFLEPSTDELGSSFHGRGLQSVKGFVRALNERIAAWCDAQSAVQYLDADAVSAMVGRSHVDEGDIQLFAHRTALDPYDDWVDDGSDVVAYRVVESLDIRTEHFRQALLRELVQRWTTWTGEAAVKLVVVDLDNTLWRGLASDGRLGSFEGRPAGIVEALHVLKQRGIVLAVVSKNDRAYIEEHWAQICGDWADEPLPVPLSLDDFAAVEISFDPKSTALARVLRDVSILPEHTVFVDDNPMERAEVVRALPGVRTLGHDLNGVRRELLRSPFTQRVLLTGEDRIRTDLVKASAAVRRSMIDGDGDEVLAVLGMTCSVQVGVAPGSADSERALQLLAKTNQWNLNGLTAGEVASSCRCGSDLTVTATVSDKCHDHGLVAMAVVCASRRRVLAAAVSCRVVGMGVDEALVAALTDHFGRLELRWRDTGRNRAAADFLRRSAENVDGDWSVAGLSAPPHVCVDVVLGEPEVRSERPSVPVGRSPSLS